MQESLQTKTQLQDAGLQNQINRRTQLIELIKIRREILIRRCRENFHTFCRTLSPDFYLPDRPHLKTLCDTLQSLYEGRLVDDRNNSYKKLMLNLPPRTGKTRSLVLFCAWALGKNPAERIIATSYGDEPANDFSRYTRNIIRTVKNSPDEIVYNDIFPASYISKDNASFEKWALHKQYFSYMGAGIWAGITGKGASILIEDDLVKDMVEALNEKRLDDLWKQRGGTLLSRKEEGAIEIMTMTRWANGDPCGRIKQDKEELKQWYILSMEAYNETTDKLLCPSLLSMESYLERRRNLPPEIFRANYHQEPLDIKGKMYKTLKTYSDVPKDNAGKLLCDRIINYTDTADEGNDFLVSISAIEYRGEAWLIDVYMTKEGMEITEPETAKRLVENSVHYAKMESNNGGRSFARAVERIIYENMKSEQEKIKAGELKEEDRQWNKTAISWFHQTENKQARIYSNSSYVMQHIYFPFNWADKWPLFYQAISTYVKEGKNQHDDAPDALTGISEMISRGQPSIRLIG